MSSNTKLLATLNKSIASMGGAGQTREARHRTARKFSQAMRIHGYSNLRDVRQVRGRHIRAFALHLEDMGLSRRTRKNAMADLRKMVRVSGRKFIADATELSNKALGIAGGSRLGSKTAMTPAEHAAFCRRARKLRRPGMSALLRLERCLGLRSAEAICARPDILRRWLVEIDEKGKIEVIAGAKGGKRREVTIHAEHRSYVKRRLHAALAVATRQGGYLVAPAAKGRRIANLEQACSVYRSYCVRAHIQAHAARYSFAQAQYLGYRRRNYSHREALMAVSLDLGHGTGRGRWVKSVYLRGLDPDMMCD